MEILPLKKKTKQTNWIEKDYIKFIDNRADI